MEIEGFNKKEWLDENKVKEGKTWTVLKAKPKCEFCDILLNDGKEVGPCWPLISSLVFVDMSSDTEERIKLSDVSHVRYYEEDEDSKDFSEDAEEEATDIED